MKFCPICFEKSIKLIESDIETKNNVSCYYSYWICKKCKERFVEIINDEGNILDVRNIKEKMSIQTTFDDFK